MTHHTTAHADVERGSGTVLALGAMAVVLLLLTALLVLGVASTAMSRARTAADAGALAAGRSLLDGASAESACSAAAHFTAAAGAIVVLCRPGTDGAGAPRVDIRVRVEHGIPGLPAASAWARAGGVEPPEERPGGPGTGRAPPTIRSWGG